MGNRDPCGDVAWSLPGRCFDDESILAFCINLYISTNINNDIKVNKGIIEVTDSPTGCMLIKREVIEKMIEKYPEKQIVQKTVINGKYVDKPNMWNFFDTLHDPKEKTYNGEDFAFCKLWRDIGGKCYAYINDAIVHVGEHQYQGKFHDELISAK